MLSERMEQYHQYIESQLEGTCFLYPEVPQQRLLESMRYSLLAGGKRLRPMFALEFCRMCGGEWEIATDYALAVEMIHTYSLIHDDLPCMDNDDYRRGKLTNHKVYGEAMAVLAGDGLLTAAFHRIAKAPCSAESRILAVEYLSECAGELGMVGGQALDMEAEHRQCTEEEILAIQRGKTGGLIAAACLMGVAAANGTPEQTQAARDFAHAFGLAFQIRDDILDVIGDQQTLGKAVGVDGNKNTFLRLYGLEACQAMVEQYSKKAVDALGIFPDHQWLAELTRSMTRRLF